MCIASDRKVFDNVYKSEPDFYHHRVDNEIAGFYDSYIITGNTDPTLNRKWLKDILIDLDGCENIELQTKNYNLKGYNLCGITTLAYSIINVKDYLKAHSFRKIKGDNRLVILLTKEFDFLTADNFDPMGYNQITFKVLQDTASEEANGWILTNEMADLTNIYEIVNKFNGNQNVSVRIDTTCQDSEGRYEIFREDGKVYNNWEDE